jgi:hypothetical protein
MASPSNSLSMSEYSHREGEPGQIVRRRTLPSLRDEGAWRRAGDEAISDKLFSNELNVVAGDSRTPNFMLY